MPKKPKPIIVETRTLSKRAASKEALRQMAKITKTESDDELETLEILSDDDDELFVPTAISKPKESPQIHFQSEPTKKTYKVSHRKSSDATERDILVLRSLSGKDETLNLEVWTEDLSDVQLALRKKMTLEYDQVSEKIEKLLKTTGAEIIYEGDSVTALEIETTTSTPIPTKTPVISQVKQTLPAKAAPKTNGPPAASSSQVTPMPLNITPSVTATPVASVPTTGYSFVVDPKSGQVVGTVVTPSAAPAKTVVNTRKRARQDRTSQPPPNKVAKIAPSAGPPPLVSLRPADTPTNSVPGSSNQTPSKVQAVVDLTSDDGRISLADTKEISFNKLQGKTFPSLVVVARPSLRVSASAAGDRSKLDLKVKSVLMHPPTKFTEWLIQQGLVRSEMFCTTHPGTKLKLGMYSDVSKFPFSGGYVWISECCPTKFVSVFQNSFFENSPHAPSILLKLVYHWACQTNVQNVIQWVKIDNMYVKGLYTWLRSACTVALHSHVPQLGGIGVEVEIGVISLGTTSQDGNQRQVKVEVLGILECHTKRIRLRAIEPLNDNDKNYKKRFAKILEPLTPWVNSNSMILTDLTVDKATLHAMGFANVRQSNNGSNQQIMDYLRRIVPRMFQNTLSLLSRQIIQQFLDELVWREWFGGSAAEAFDNILLHISEQTRALTGQSLVVRLNKVAANPFRNWSILSQLSREVKTYEEAPKRQRRKPTITRPQSPTPTQDLLRPAKPSSPDIPETMVPLENYYYGSIETINPLEKIGMSLKCHLCKELFNTNIKLMQHYFHHALGPNVSGNNRFQCIYCLTCCVTPEALKMHVQSMHPSSTKVGDEYACIICEVKFKSSYMLGKHMSKTHVPSELPYQCSACKFRCSSHKEAIDHFHTAHLDQGVIQCPFCLKTTTIAVKTRNLGHPLHYYLLHLQKHQRKNVAKKCSKCALWFIQKDGVQAHMTMHLSQRRTAGLKPQNVSRDSLMVPKSCEDIVEEENTDISNLILDVPKDSHCKECNQKLTTSNHFPSVLSCSYENCQYITCCQKAMHKHTDNCKTAKLKFPGMKLPFKMFCVCGYSDIDGNSMANHLAVCERKSAYPSLEAAKGATVTHSMLDVLGLVRRPEEPVPNVDTIDITSDSEMTKDDENDKKTEVNDSKKPKIILKINKFKKEAVLKTSDLEETGSDYKRNVNKPKKFVKKKSEESTESDVDDPDDPDEIIEKKNEVKRKAAEKEVSDKSEESDGKENEQEIVPDSKNDDGEKNDDSDEKGENDVSINGEIESDKEETGSTEQVESMDIDKPEEIDADRPEEMDIDSNQSLLSEITNNIDEAQSGSSTKDALLKETNNLADLLDSEKELSLSENLEEMINNAQEKLLSEQMTHGDDVEGLLKEIIDGECTKSNEISDALLAN